MSIGRKVIILIIIALAGLISIAAVDILGCEYPGSNLVICAVTGIAILAWGFYLFYSSFRLIHGSMQTLNQVIGSVEQTSTRSYFTSKNLADGASTQAASLEETAASLEEIKAMTVSNADNACKGRDLMQKALVVIRDSDQSMNEMTVAMNEIHQSSRDISNIIKKIDEISFQTNLLALNAAVEAARAGEHGAGFAVVAEEVRNLALRSTEAAKDTQEMIQNSLDKVIVGVELVEKTEGKFKDVIDSSDAVGGLVDEIAQACIEQRTGLEQIATAMNEIDMVTHKSVEQASESADISGEIEHEAGSLRETVSELALVLDGNHIRNDARQLVKKALKMARKSGLQSTLAAIQDKNGPFTKGDELYVYAGSTDYVTLLAHPVTPDKLCGPDLSELADIKGKTFFNDLIQLAESRGEGWVSYWWPKPGESAPSLKSTFLMKVPGEKVYFGCGIYA
ncbi:MAG: cache domain-containing protein [Deltaproteobacteria bacterium]|nr:cache domain-containing protein [Candidatus Tharpella aukensis]